MEDKAVKLHCRFMGQTSCILLEFECQCVARMQCNKCDGIFFEPGKPTFLVESLSLKNLPF